MYVLYKINKRSIKGAIYDLMYSMFVTNWQFYTALATFVKKWAGLSEGRGLPRPNTFTKIYTRKWREL